MTEMRHRTDHELKEAIVLELGWTPSVHSDGIGVGVKDGAVTLSGEVASLPEKEEAVRSAHRVAGVVAVADEIVVQSGWGVRNDADIARDAGTALEHSVLVPDGAVMATVQDHVVALTGEVTWHYQREGARRAVASLPGVRAVRNMIVLKPKSVVTPIHAKAEVTAALVRNAQLDAKEIRVEVNGSEVKLQGTVSSWAEVRQAEHAAWSMPGVTHVDNRLVVIPEPTELATHGRPIGPSM